jgi:hypothetical protein
MGLREIGQRRKPRATPRSGKAAICSRSGVSGKSTANRLRLSSPPQGADQRTEQTEVGLQSGTPRASETQQDQEGLWYLSRTICRDACCSRGGLRHLQEEGPQTMHRSLPRHPGGRRAALQQMQHRARVLRRRPRTLACGDRLPEARARQGVIRCPAEQLA